MGLCLVLVLAASSGCGYTQELTLPNDIKTVFVPTFKDEIPINDRYAYRPGLEIDLTNALIDRFIFDGNLKIVSEENADSVLEGAIVSYKQEALRFDDLESVEEYRLFLVVSFQLIDKRTGEVILEESNFSGRSEFFTSTSSASTGVRRIAANDAVGDLARSLVDYIVEGWY